MGEAEGFIRARLGRRGTGKGQIDPEEVARLMGLMEEERAKIDAYNQELEARARPRGELVEAVEFQILSASTVFSSHGYSPLSEVHMGRSSPSYDTGQSARLELRVVSACFPEIQLVRFAAPAALQKGDTIHAYILRAREESFRAVFDLPSPDRRVFYVERDFHSEEDAFKIEKLFNGDVVACYSLEGSP